MKRRRFIFWIICTFRSEVTSFRLGIPRVKARREPWRGSEEAQRKATYVEGLELERATVARTIFERLVKEGRAEAV
jgi:hypothetical protein